MLISDLPDSESSSEDGGEDGIEIWILIGVIVGVAATAALGDLVFYRLWPWRKLRIGEMSMGDDIGHHKQMVRVHHVAGHQVADIGVSLLGGSTSELELPGQLGFGSPELSGELASTGPLIIKSFGVAQEMANQD